MEQRTALEKLNAIAVDESKQWKEKAGWRNENREWLDKSAKIAIRILREIRAQKEVNGMSQKKLAEIVGVTPQYINKIVKGKENLSLSTICKIEGALGITLVEIPQFEITSEVLVTSLCGFAIPRNGSKLIAKQETNYNAPVTYQPEETIKAA